MLEVIAVPTQRLARLEMTPGLLRMRAWGVVLGATASLVCLAIAPFYGRMNALTLSLSALPALALWLVPILVARATTPRAPALPRSRIAASEAPVETEELVDESFVETDIRPRPALRRAW